MIKKLIETVIFRQQRIGKNGRPFTLYKFRTMYIGAHLDQKRFQHLNQGTPPAFKIYDDPRFTKIGKFLSNSGIDELPQIINIIKGDMNIFGPRPLPTDEDNQLPDQWRKLRHRVKPGVISSWTIQGGHSLTQTDWKRLDAQDVQSIKSIKYKINLFYRFIMFFVKKIF